MLHRSSFRIAAVLLLMAAPACGAERWNVLLICVDDLRPELKCFGRDYIHSPHIDRLAASGRAFHRHYVQAPTCGASRFTLLTGRYGPAGNGALFNRAARIARGARVPDDMPTWFRNHGYTTVSVGKVSHHPGGRGGKNWDDPEQPEMPGAWDTHLLPAGKWKHPRGWMHGLAHGEIRGDASRMSVIQAAAGADEIYPDGPSIAESLVQMDRLAADESKPFFLAVGILRPHLPFGAPARYLNLYRDRELPPIAHPQKPAGRTTWHRSGEFMKYRRDGRDPNHDQDFADQVRRHYAACVSFADAQVGKLLNRLEQLELEQKTVVVLWGDHGWHLGEHGIWGKHALFEESLRSPLIIRYPSLPNAGQATSAIVETRDLFPTLCDLVQLPPPDDLPGVSLRPQLESHLTQGHAAVSYTSRVSTIRTDRFRLILHADGHTELYDHSTAAGETADISNNHSQVVAELTQRLQQRLAQRSQ